MAPASNRIGRQTHRMAVAVTVVIAAAMLILAACQRKPVMTHSTFVHLPLSGWQRTMPLTFTPEYDDSARTYELTLAVRHVNSYAYRNLSLVVDVIAVDSTVSRKPLDIRLADEYGNWTGGGFGTLYQDAVCIASVVDPDDARRVVVWQAMQDCDTIFGLADIGLIVKPL